MATIDKFLKETDSISSFFSRLNTQEVRIPPQMYEVMHDPEFKKAKEEKTYSKMYDIIFKKALELANGDVEKALFISLISIDLRDRGLSGAIQGPRGHTIVPLGIFDNEEMKTSVIGSRYDAAQHFFGYALLAKKFGKRAALAYSSTTKTQALAHLGRFFRDRHVGIDPDFGLDNGFKIDGGLSPTSWFQGEDLRVRPDYDKKADKLYNNMGSNFGSLISKNPRALPSQVITDPKYQPLLNEIGVPQDRSNTWSVKPKEAMIEGKTKYIYKNIGSMEFKSDKLNIPSADIENGEITFIPISNGNTINDCINHKNSKLFNLGEYTVLQLNFGDSKECQRFFKQNKQEMIIIHRNRRYHLTTNPEN